MKLLFDENLSPRLPGLLREEFLGSSHAREVGLLGKADSHVCAVLVNMGSGACFELNRVGFEIWRALGPGATVG